MIFRRGALGKKKNKVSPASSENLGVMSPKTRVLSSISPALSQHSSSESCSSVESVDRKVEMWTEGRKCGCSIIGTMFFLIIIATFFILVLFSTSAIITLYEVRERENEHDAYRFNLLLKNTSHTTKSFEMTIAGFETYRRMYFNQLVKLEGGDRSGMDYLSWAFISHVHSIREIFGRGSFEMSVFAFEKSSGTPSSSTRVLGCIRYDFGKLVICEVPESAPNSFNYTLYDVLETSPDREGQIDIRQLTSFRMPDEQVRAGVALFSEIGGGWLMAPRSVFSVQYPGAVQVVWSTLNVENAENRNITMLFHFAKPATEADERVKDNTPENAVTWGLEVNRGIVVFSSDYVPGAPKMFYPFANHPNEAIRQWSEWILDIPDLRGAVARKEQLDSSYSSVFRDVCTWSEDGKMVEYIGRSWIIRINFNYFKTNATTDDFMQLLIITASPKWIGIMSQMSAVITWFVFGVILAVMIFFAISWSITVFLLRSQSKKIEREMGKLLTMNLRSVNLDFFFFNEFVFFKSTLATLVKRLIRYRSFLPESILAKHKRGKDSDSDDTDLNSDDSSFDDLSDTESDTSLNSLSSDLELGHLSVVESVVIQISFEMLSECTSEERKMFFWTLFKLANLCPGAKLYDFSVRRVKIIITNVELDCTKEINFIRIVLSSDLSSWIQPSTLRVLVAKGLCYEGCVGTLESRKYSLDGKPFDDIERLGVVVRETLPRDADVSFLCNETFYRESNIRMVCQTRIIHDRVVQCGEFIDFDDEVEEEKHCDDMGLLVTQKRHRRRRRSTSALATLGIINERWKLYLEAYSKFEAGDLPNAMVDLKKFIKQNPEDSVAVWKLGEWKKLQMMDECYRMHAQHKK